ncbi:MAG: sodium:solute symporter family protein [Deltaproteobacteria bacterium]|nr:sodium:solute symporter family protein [Deltaproteobacteria bacterium]
MIGIRNTRGGGPERLGILHWLDVVVVGLYLAGMLGIGLWLSKRHKGFDDFFLAGRAMTTPLLVTTLVSTYYGLDVLFGTSEIGFNSGLVGWFGYSRPYYIFYIIAAFLLARRLREEGFKSLPDILERYYGRPSRYVSAVASFCYSLPVISLFGFGWMSNVLFGWDPQVGAFIVGGVALVYTWGGGLWAVALTDSVQFVLMCVMVAIAVPFSLNAIGGFDRMYDLLPAAHFTQMGDMTPWLVVIYGMTGLTVLVEPTFYQRIFAARDYKAVRNALLIGLFLWGAYDWCVTLLGMIARAGAAEGLLPADMHPNTALLRIAVASLPVGVLGLFVAGIMSTAMSTIDSYCLIGGGNVAYDLYRPIANPKATDDQLIKVTRFGVVLSWVLGFVIAFYFDRIMSIWVFLATILTSTVFVPIILGLFCKGFRTRSAGLWGTTAGLVGAIAFYVTFGLFGEEAGGTRIITLTWFGGPIEVWEEFAMFFTLPFSLVAYLAGVAVDRLKGGRS